MVDYPTMDLEETTAPYRPRLLTARGGRIAVAFSDRNGGVSDAPYDSLNLGLLVGDDEGAVWENRMRVAATAGFDVNDLVLARQIHGADVIEVERGASGMVGQADVLVAPFDASKEDEGRAGGPRTGPVLGILTADCAPVIVEGAERVAVIHAGWRGLVAGAIEAGLEAVGNVNRAWVGPCIHACCYEVGPDVIEAFEARNLPVSDESHVDPSVAAETELRRLGVTEVVVAEDCTACDPRYFSVRRDGTTGRQGAFAWATS